MCTHVSNGSMMKYFSTKVLNCLFFFFFSTYPGPFYVHRGSGPFGGLSEWLLSPAKPPERKDLSVCLDSSSQTSCPRKRGMAPAVTAMPVKQK